MQLSIDKMKEGTWVILEDGVRFFLLEGDEKALLIDCGMQTDNALEIAQSLTDRPVELLLTHADRDHAGSIKEFEHFYMHPAEASNFYHSNQLEGDFIPVEDGEVLDLGNRPIRVILTSGHTPGSIALLDIRNRILFSGDPIQDGNIFMFGIQREMHAYRKSLKKLLEMQDEFDDIYPSHGSLPLKIDMVEELYEVSEKVMNHEFSGPEAEMFGCRVEIIDVGIAKFMIDAK